MLGFSDIQDLDFLSSREVARRMGFMSWASLGRALKAKGEDLPPALLRGKHRGDILKAWFSRLPVRGDNAQAPLGDGDRQATRPARDGAPSSSRPPSRPEDGRPALPAADVIALDARRQAALARLRSA